jgi:hypothetical protein
VRELLTWQPPANLPAASSPPSPPSPLPSLPQPQQQQQQQQQEVQVPKPLPRNASDANPQPNSSPPALIPPTTARSTVPRSPGPEAAVSPLAALANVASSGALMTADDAVQPAGATLSGQVHSPRRKRKAGSAISSEGLPSASGARLRASAHLQPLTPRQPAALQLLQPALSPRDAPAPAPPEAPAKECSNAAGRGPEPAAKEVDPGPRVGQAAANNRTPAPAQMRKGTNRTAGAVQAACPLFGPRLLDGIGYRFHMNANIVLHLSVLKCRCRQC